MYMNPWDGIVQSFKFDWWSDLISYEIWDAICTWNLELFALKDLNIIVTGTRRIHIRRQGHGYMINNRA